MCSVLLPPFYQWWRYVAERIQEQSPSYVEGNILYALSSWQTDMVFKFTLMSHTGLSVKLMADPNCTPSHGTRMSWLFRLKKICNIAKFCPTFLIPLFFFVKLKHILAALTATKEFNNSPHSAAHFHWCCSSWTVHSMKLGGDDDHKPLI